MRILAFLSCLALFPADIYSQTSSLAKIEKIKKSEHIVIINAGSGNSALGIGSNICFYDQDNTKVVCGEVIRTLTAYAYVGVASEKINLLSVGWKAELAPANEPIAEQPTPQPQPTPQTDVVTPIPAKPAVGNLKLLYASSLLSSVTYKSLAYSFPGVGESTWVDAGSIRTAKLGGGAELEYKFGDYNADAGFRLIIMDQADNISQSADGANQAVTSTKALSAAGYVDMIVYEAPFSDGVKFKLGSGIQTEFSAVTIDALGSDGASLITGSSNLAIASLRLAPSIQLDGDGVGFIFGATFVVPFLELDRRGALNSDAKEDFFASLQHKKAPFGIDAVAAIFWSF